VVEEEGPEYGEVEVFNELEEVKCEVDGEVAAAAWAPAAAADNFSNSSRLPPPEATELKN